MALDTDVMFVIGISGFDIRNNAYLLYRKGIVGFHAEYNVFAVKPFCKYFASYRPGPAHRR